MSQVIIRKYSVEDKPHCLETFKSNVPDFFTVEEINDFENFLDQFEIRNESREPLARTLFYVVESDGKIVGCGGFGDKENNKIISLAWAHIHRDYHKHGFGKLLLEYRLEKIKSLFPNQTVFIDTTQHSTPFYEKYGFITQKITKDFYAPGLDRYDLTLSTNNSVK
jgi:N-acetylglutamate synthase-like GNAT family acetyltransferase